MAWPSAMTTRIITFGSAFSLVDGASLRMRITITPVLPAAVRSGQLVWAATGQPVIPLSETISSDDTGSGQVLLPCTDQTGFTDGAGNTLIPGEDGNSFTYRVQVSVLKDNTIVFTSGTSTIALPAGNGEPVDFDTMVPVTGAVGGTVVSIPDQWSTQLAAISARVDQVSSSISASSYGFTPDGTAAGNATALQTAVAAAIADGAPLTLPHGVFHIDSGVTVDGPVEIAGSGRGLTVIHQDAKATHIFKATAPGITIRDLTLEGAGLDATGLPLYGDGSFRGHVGVWVDRAADNFRAFRIEARDLGIGIALENPCPISPDRTYDSPIAGAQIDDLLVSGVWCAVEGKFLAQPRIANISGSYRRFGGAPSSGDTSSPAHLVYLSGTTSNISIGGSVENIEAYGTTDYSSPVALKFWRGGSVTGVTGTGTLGLVEADTLSDMDMHDLRAIDSASPSSYALATINLSNVHRVRIYDAVVENVVSPPNTGISINSASDHVELIRCRVSYALTSDLTGAAAITVNGSDCEVSDPRIDVTGSTLGYGVYATGDRCVITDPTASGKMMNTVRLAGKYERCFYNSYRSLPPRSITGSVCYVTRDGKAGHSYGSGTVPAAPTGFVDLFDRDDAATLGYTDDLKPWRVFGASGEDAVNNVWKITANSAQFSAGSGRSIAVADAGLSDGTLTAVIQTVGVSDGGGVEGLALRAVDSDNLLHLTIAASTIRLDQRISGTKSAITTYSGTVAAGDTITVTLLGASITVSKNGAQVLTATTNQFQTATLFGMFGAASGHQQKMASITFTR